MQTKSIPGISHLERLYYICCSSLLPPCWASIIPSLTGTVTVRRRTLSVWSISVPYWRVIRPIFFIKNTVLFTLVTSIAKTVLGLFLALLLVSGVKAANLHRMIIFSPQVLSFLIVGLVFKSLLDPNNGFVNVTLRSMGLDVLAQNWLGSLTWAMPSIMAVDTWKGMGYIMVLFIAGLLAIPRDYYEAASIDGAGFGQKLFRITIPMLMPTITIATVLNITYGLRVFDAVYVLTNGGPGNATDVINTAVYSSFAKGYWGLGSALSTILFVIMAIISFFIIRLMNRKVEY